MHNCYPLRQLSGFGAEGGQMVPSRTYIKEGLWNGDKCEQPCQTVCVDLDAFGLAAYLATFAESETRAPDKTKPVLFSQLLQDVLSPFFISPRWSPREWHHTTISKGENRGFLWEMQKSFNFFLTNRFSLHEILIKTDCLRRGRAQWGICIPSLFWLVHYFISEIPPCGFCQPENTSDEGVLDSLILPLLPDRCWHLSGTP